MTINQRVQKIIDELYSGNQRAFSVAIGVTASVIGNIVGKRQSHPSFELIEKIIYSNENINIEWLLTGRGKMLKEADSVKMKKTDIVSEDQANYGSILINEAKPFIDGFNVSGLVPDYFDTLIGTDSEKMIIPFLPDYDFSLRHHGESMINKENPQHSIDDNDIVACKLWKGRSYILWGEVYALVTCERIIVRKVVQSEKEGNIRCVSFNEDNGYGAFDLPINDLLDMAIVVGVFNVRIW